MIDKAFKLPCKSLLQAVRIGLNITGDYTEMQITGDFGQDEALDDFGMGNGSFSIVSHAGGTATLLVDESAMYAYLERKIGHG